MSNNEVPFLSTWLIYIHMDVITGKKVKSKELKGEQRGLLDGNVLRLTVMMVGQLCEFTKDGWIASPGWTVRDENKRVANQSGSWLTCVPKGLRLYKGADIGALTIAEAKMPLPRHPRYCVGPHLGRCAGHYTEQLHRKDKNPRRLQTTLRWI